MSSKRVRNLFLAFGVVAVVIMLLTFNISYTELWHNLQRAGYYLPLVLLLWLVIYLINNASWYIILRSGGSLGGLSFFHLYKFTISAFSLNYVTPVGLMGGEPYRIMELTPYVGVGRATSSVILYVMMHIFSHFLFWLSAVALYVLLFHVNWEMGILLGIITLFCLLLGVIFVKGYRHGMAVACMRIAGKIPFVRKHAIRFTEKHRKQLEEIDQHIVLLHRQRKTTFYSALTFEYLSRVVSCGEIWLILNVLTTNVSFLDCFLILAFSSLIANLLFFMPMQLGGREGGLALAVGSLSLSGAYGVYTSLITRVRELVWVMIGLALMKVGNKKKQPTRQTAPDNQ
jgi:uncharacterized membrane protein YbhN (UPF0104 family)